MIGFAVVMSLAMSSNHDKEVILAVHYCALLCITNHIKVGFPVLHLL
jgi:hypothetical protein